MSLCFWIAMVHNTVGIGAGVPALTSPSALMIGGVTGWYQARRQDGVVIQI